MDGRSGDRVDFPTFEIEKRELPIMLCGSAQFLGMNQFGFKAFDLRVKFYNHPDNMAELLVHFIRQGCRGAHVLCYENILKAVKMAYDFKSFPIIASLLSEDVASQLKKLSSFDTALVLVHASITDSLDEAVLRTLICDIRDAGMVPGLATLSPGTTIPTIDGMNLDFPAYMAPINLTGTYMIPTKESTLEAIASTPKSVIAEKPLAAGRISPQEGFPFVMEHCSGFCVDVISKEQIDRVYEVLIRMMGT
jgi:hypothetical protein